jgi:ABC-type iron transport system FetAB permease component
MFWMVLVTMLVSSTGATVLGTPLHARPRDPMSSYLTAAHAPAHTGTALCMNAVPLWEPTRFIPTFGMLLGNMMASVALAINYCLDTVALNKGQIELRLSFGATWWEAARPMAVEALRLAMLPTLNAMSVMGLITIPGMVRPSLSTNTHTGTDRERETRAWTL